MNLTPAEEATVARFGMFDTEILDELEEHADDTLPCWIDGCDAGADAALITRCCRRDRRDLCAPHVEAARERWASEAGTAKVSCSVRGHVFPAGVEFDVVVEVVPV